VCRRFMSAADCRFSEVTPAAMRGAFVWLSVEGRANGRYYGICGILTCQIRQLPQRIA
jgi:hypothetical protein